MSAIDTPECNQVDEAQMKLIMSEQEPLFDEEWIDCVPLPVEDECVTGAWTVLMQIMTLPPPFLQTTNCVKSAQLVPQLEAIE